MSGMTFEQMNEWREETTRVLEHMASFYDCIIKVVNPVDYYNFESKRYQNQKEVMQFDLNHVKSSDIVIVNLDGLNSSIGSAIELYECYKRDVPVIAFGEKELYEGLHPWIKECITRVEDNCEMVATYICEFYMM